MMEFLDKIYGYEHFGVLLFSAIGILIVLFAVILFFGKKDEKKREIERTQKLELEKQEKDALAIVNEDPTQLNVEPAIEIESEISEPALEPIAEPNFGEESVDGAEEVASVTEPVFEPVISVEPEIPVAPILEPIQEPELALVTEEPKEVVNEPVIEPSTLEVSEVNAEEFKAEPMDFKIPEFNFDELAASIANELKELENNKNDLNKYEEVIVEEPKIPVSEFESSLKEEVKTVIEQPKTVTRPVTFSSVYINKPAEPVISVEEPAVQKEVVVEPVIEDARPINKMPDIELPKPAEMPKLNDDVNSEPVKPIAVPDFSNFEGESYDIK